MLISGSTCQKEEKECISVKYLIDAVLSQFKICCNLCIFFPPYLYSQISEFRKKCFFPSPGGYRQLQRNFRSKTIVLHRQAGLITALIVYYLLQVLSSTFILTPTCHCQHANKLYHSIKKSGSNIGGQWGQWYHLSLVPVVPSYISQYCQQYFHSSQCWQLYQHSLNS